MDSKYSIELIGTHFQATMRIVRYVKGTKDDGIHYYSNEDSKLFGYSKVDLT